MVLNNSSDDDSEVDIKATIVLRFTSPLHYFKSSSVVVGVNDVDDNNGGARITKDVREGAMPRFMFDGEMNLTSGKQVLGKRGKMKGRWIEVPRKDDGEFVWNFGALA
ncbi:hypothetical protein GYH30_044684 [Glycine max]|nr:hypothetical protein GYH30_044684 [Glycine max]